MDWDELYRTDKYKNHWDSSYASPELVGYVSSLGVDNEYRVLDLGCGSGEDAIFMANHVREAYGVDISKAAIEIAKKKALRKGSDAKFVIGSVFSLPFDKDTFDLMTDRGCLHNIDLPDWAKYESEVFRTLRVGGTLFLRGARKVEEYGTGFTFIEQDNLNRVFSGKRWSFNGPYSYTMFSDATDGTLYSNLFILRKLSASKI